MSKKARFLWAVAGAAACLAAAGCAAKKDMDELRAFLKEPRSPVSATEYRVLPPDVISITSRHVPEINNISDRVRPDGKVNLPLLGEIYVAEKTPKEIEEALTAAAKNYYEQVDATVRVTGYNSQWIYVFGQVSRPGPVPWTGADTLLDVLARVQPTDLAWPERILLVRGKPPRRGGHPFEMKAKGEEEVVENPDAPRVEKMMINLWSMVKEGDMAQNVLLQPEDTIYVQPNPLAAVGLALQQLLFPVRPFAETIRTPASVGGAVAGPLVP